MAAVVAILGTTMLRVGNDEYERSNGSFGLTTLRSRHARLLPGGSARLRFRGKSGVVHDKTLDDARLVAVVRRCQQLPGQRLFQYRDDAGRLRMVTSTDVNAYLREAMGEDFSAKDFRSWGGTAMALRLLSQRPPPESDAEAAAVQADVARSVAAVLGNTPAMTRKAYIDPAVFACWKEGVLQSMDWGRGYRQFERAAVRVLRAAHRKA